MGDHFSPSAVIFRLLVPCELNSAWRRNAETGEAAVMLPRAGHRLTLKSKGRRAGTRFFCPVDSDCDGLPLLLPFARLPLTVDACPIGRKFKRNFVPVRHDDRPPLDSALFSPIDGAVPSRSRQIRHIILCWLCRLHKCRRPCISGAERKNAPTEKA
jgi:hypothetical protein